MHVETRMEVHALSHIHIHLQPYRYNSHTLTLRHFHIWMLMHTSMDTCVGTGYFTYSQSHKLALRVTWTHTPTHYTTPSFLPLGSVLLSPPAAPPSPTESVLFKSFPSDSDDQSQVWEPIIIPHSHFSDEVSNLPKLKGQFIQQIFILQLLCSRHSDLIA